MFSDSLCQMPWLHQESMYIQNLFAGIIFHYTFHSKNTLVRGMLFFKSEFMVICLEIFFKHPKRQISNIFEQTVTNAIGLQLLLSLESPVLFLIILYHVKERNKIW